MNNFLAGLLINTAHAITVSGTKLPDPLGGRTITDIVDGIFQFLAFQAGPIVLTIFIVVGGYQMLFSAGNAETFGKGKKTILYAVIGYIALLMARGIVAIVKTIITGA